MDLRFVVGRRDGPQSAHWKFWTQGDEAYLLQQGPMATRCKFSFHKSGNCRWAQINPHMKGSERAMLEWMRGPIPDLGSGQACLLLSIVFPTTHLSGPRATKFKKTCWIDPADAGQAVQLQILMTQERPATIAKLLDRNEHCRLIGCLTLRNGAVVAVSASAVDCGPVELEMPGIPGVQEQVFGQLSFPEADERNTGRPIRLIMMSQNTIPPTLWELGGYEVRALATPE